MTDKVNLQALFDEQKNQHHSKQYTLSEDQRDLLSKRAFERVYSPEEVEAMRARQRATPTYRLKVLREKDVLTEQEQQELHAIEEKIWLRDEYRRGVPLSEEHCQAIRKAYKKRPIIVKESQKANQSKAAKKRWEVNPYIPTEEVLKKRSEGMKKAWAERKALMPPKVVEPPEPPKPRGRPRTRPLPDPNQPKKKRGRPPKVL